ncbi:hypothetical protein AB0M64_35220 [Streptomyces sp. NPDC051771]|uniref:hypothetical protein n=1 Tax=Streptomyces sp. NPDC051771 TaxID=3154847 RepID=UPI0034121830
MEDLEAPRDNVLVFHGIGGIGKTTLSRKLEAALASAEHRPVQWGAPAWPATSKILPVRIPLHDVHGDYRHSAGPGRSHEVRLPDDPIGMDMRRG